MPKIGSAPIAFDLAAAQEALARSDEGATPLPGDDTLITAYESYCQQSWEDLQYEIHEAGRDTWLADQCRFCGPEGATGDCGDCDIPAVAA